jgi:hypothetical protein
MTIPIPSGIPANSSVDFHRDELIAPPSAPTQVNSIQSIDPRTALLMPTPVTGFDQNTALGNAVQSQKNINNAVLLELSNANTDSVDQNKNLALESILAESLSRMDSLGSKAIGQLLSSFMGGDAQNFNTNSSAKDLQNQVMVTWPSTNQAMNTIGLQGDPRVIMSNLYSNLEHSGIFAADQRRRLLMPASAQDEQSIAHAGSLMEEVKSYLSQITDQSAAVEDSVKLLLKGELVWQGMIGDKVHSKLSRSDTWESDPKNPNQLLKGVKLALEIDLPVLGKVMIMGTEFGGNINITVESSPEAKREMAGDFDNVLTALQQIDPKAQVSLKVTT